MNSVFVLIMTHRKRLFILLIILFFLIIAGYILLKNKLTKQATEEEMPTEQLNQTNPRLMIDTKNLHWVNNDELYFTYFDKKIGGNALAKITKNSSIKQNILINKQIKLSEIFWSGKNDLLIFDYGTPYTTFLFVNQKSLLPLTNITGYGFSWAPSGNDFFYKKILPDGDEAPMIYNTVDNTEKAVVGDFPPFIASYWSSNNKSVLLYDFSFETGSGNLSLFNFETGIITHTQQVNNANFPAWSPSGESFSFVSDGGLYTKSPTEDKKNVYTTTSPPLSLSYGWLSDNEVLLFDSEKSQIFLINISDPKNNKIIKSLSLKPNQRIQISQSPDKKTVAIGTEKEGLFLLDKALLLQNTTPAGE